MIGSGHANTNNALESFNRYAVGGLIAGSRTTLAAFFASINNFMKLQSSKYGGIYVQAPLTPADVRSWVRLTDHARKKILGW